MADRTELEIRVVEHTRDPSPVAGVLRELRPQYGDDESITTALLGVIRTQGVRVFGAHASDANIAVGAVTVRIVESLSWGRFLYVDDLVTSESMRGHGIAGHLMDHVDRLAGEAGIAGRVQLDSGVGVQRADAHAFYGRRRMWIAGFHFIQRS